jgi:hypothetical protein
MFMPDFPLFQLYCLDLEQDSRRAHLLKSGKNDYSGRQAGNGTFVIVCYRNFHTQYMGALLANKTC